MSITRLTIWMLCFALGVVSIPTPIVAATIKLIAPVEHGDLQFVKTFLKSRLVDPGHSFDEYFKAYQPPFDKFEAHQIAWARHDLDGDGPNEFIIQFQHPGICGSGGCLSFIFREQGGRWMEIGRFSGGGEIETTDPVIDGWPRLFSHEVCLIWIGKKYRTRFNDPFEMGVDPECRR